MNTNSAVIALPAALRPGASFTLRYDSLHQAGHCLSFPCDERGNIDLDTLPDRALTNYLAARAMVGRDFAHPVIEMLRLAA